MEKIYNDISNLRKNKIMINVCVCMYTYIWGPLVCMEVVSKLIINNLGLCASGCGQKESVDHLLWVVESWGTMISSSLMVDHLFSRQTAHTYYFKHFECLGGDSRKRRSSIHLIWLACVLLRKEQNCCIFCQKEMSIQ
jgi:hypothetical protein